MSLNIGTAVAYLEMDTSKFSGGLNSAWKDLQQFTDSTNSAEDRLKGLSGAMGTVGAGITKGVTVPLLGVAAAAVKVGMGFDKQMSKVKAISGATGEEFEQLRQKAIQMGNDTAFSQTEAAQAFEYMAMAGWKTSDMLDGVEGIMNLAAASGEDLATTSDIVTDALTAFGLKASDAGHFADVLAAASTNSNTNVAMMGETFKYAAPLAGTLGYSIEDVAIAIGLMANGSIKGSQAGTSLARIMNRMIDGTGDAGIAMERLGLSLEDGEGSMKSFRQVMIDLRESLGGVMMDNEEFTRSVEKLDGQLSDGTLTQKEYDSEMESLIERTYGAEEATKAHYAAMLAGSYGLSGLLNIVNASQEDFDKLANAIDGATDDTTGYSAAAEMAKDMLDNFAGSVTLLFSALGTAAGVISDRVTPYVQELTEKVKGLVIWFNNLSDEEQDQIIKWGMVAAAIGPVLLILSKITGVVASVVGFISNMQASLVGLKTVLAAVTSPVAVAVGAFAALAAAFMYLWNTNEGFKNQITETWNQLKETFSMVADGIIERVNALGFDFDSFGQMVSKLFGTISDIVLGILAPAFTNGFQAIADIVQGVFDILFGLYDFFAGVFSGDMESALYGLGRAFDALLETVGNVVDGILTFFGEMVSNILRAVGLDELAENFEQKFGEIKDFIMGIPEAILEFANNVITFFTETIPETISGFIDGVGEKVEEFKLFFTEGIPGAIEEFKILAGEKLDAFVMFFTETIPKALNDFVTVTLPGVINGIIEWFSTLPYRIGYFIGQVLGHVFLFGTELGTTVVQAVKKGITNIINFFKELPGKVKEFIDDVIEKVIEWSVKMGKKATETGKNFLNFIVNFFRQLPGRVKTFITTTFNNVKTWATNMINKAIETGRNFLQNIVNFFMQLPGKVKTFVTNAYNNVVAWTRDMINKAIETGTQFLNNIVSFFTQLPGKIKTKVTEAYNKVIEWKNDMIKKAKEVGKEFLDEIVKQFKELPGKMKEFMSDAVQAIKDKVGDFVSAGKDVFNGVLDGIKEIAGSITEYVSGFVSGIKDLIGGIIQGFKDVVSGAKDAEKASRSVDGSHANGLSYVPFNGYIAELHEGERVLTKSENERYSRGAGYGSGGDVFNFYDTVKNPYEYARAVKKAKRELQYGF